MIPIKSLWLFIELAALIFYALEPDSGLMSRTQKPGLNTYDIQDSMGFGFDVPGNERWTNELGPAGFPNKIQFENSDTAILAEVRHRDPESDLFTGEWETVTANLKQLAEENLGKELLSFDVVEREQNYPGLYGFHYTCQRENTKLYIAVFYQFGQSYTAEFVGIDTDKNRGYERTMETAKSFVELGGEAHMIGYRPPMLGAGQWDYPYLHNPFAVTLYYLDFIAPTKERQKTDYVIQWKDDGMEALIRTLLQNTDGDIMSSDLDHFTNLSITFQSTYEMGYHCLANEMAVSIPTEEIEIHSIEDILEFKNLISLDLNLPGLKDFTPISDITELKRLFLTCDEKIESLEWLRPLKNLVFLDMWTANLTVTDITPIGELKELERMRLSLPYVYDLSPLAGLPNLTELDIYPGGTENLDQLDQVEILAISVEDFGSLSALAELPNLKRLYLYHSGDMDDQAVRDATQIKHLVINGEDIRTEAWE